MNESAFQSYVNLLRDNGFKDIVPKIIFLQKEGLAEEDIERVKDAALAEVLVSQG